MNSSKLMLILITLIVILVAIMAYLLTNSEPKDISFYDKNETQQIEQKNESTEKPTETHKKQTPKAKNVKQEPKTEKNNTSKLKTQESLRAEYQSFIEKSKRDKSLGEPRYNVYVLDSKKLNSKEKATINDITTTLSERGGYLRYSLIIDKISDGKILIYLYNENLLDETRWIKSPENLPQLLFKFNQNTMQSIKNSFYIKRLKAKIGKKAKIRNIELIGHADELGNDFYNSMLGLKRSAAVASEFLRQSGKITLQSFGKDKPVSTGLSKKERYKNRRVEVKFL